MSTSRFEGIDVKKCFQCSHFSSTVHCCTSHAGCEAEGVDCILVISQPYGMPAGLFKKHILLMQTVCTSPWI